MASTAQDQARLLVTIEATQAKFAKQLAAIAKNAGDTANGIEKNFKRANDNAGRAADDGSKKATRAFNQQRAAAQQLSFQLNDIATQLLSGTSPFTVMAQQGGQVSQALNSAGGARGAVTALGAAFAGLANPIGLASIALIGIVGYATQYLTTLIGSGEKSNKVIKEQAELIQRVADRWGDAVPALKAYADQLKRAQDESELREATQLRIEDIFKGARDQVRDLRVDIADLVSQLRLAGAEEDDIIRIQKAFEALSTAVNENKDSAKENQELLTALSRVYINTGVPAANDFAKKIYEIADAFKEVARQAAEAAEQERKALEASRLANLPNMLPGNLGQLPPLYSGGGRFMDQGAAQNFRADGTKSQTQIEQEKKAAEALRELKSAAEDAARKLQPTIDLTTDVIRSFEGFRNTPYWDVNAMRAGFGSDTVTLADGSVQKVTQGMRVSMQDALRDLTRRIGEFRATIERQIGPGAFGAMNEQQQAALTSIAYNYGSLPERIVQAIRTGSAETVEAAIRGLGTDNGGINAGRRNAEADLWSGQAVSGITAISDGLKSASQHAKEFDAAQKSAAQTAEQMGQAVGQALSSLISALSDGKLEAHELLQIALQLLQVFSRMPGGGGVGGFLSGLLGAFGGFATGTANTGGSRGQVRGVVHGQEAVIPLPTGGRVPVEVRGAGGGGMGSTYAPVYNIDARGADAGAVARLERGLAERDRKFGRMVDQRNHARSSRGVRP